LPNTFSSAFSLWDDAEKLVRDRPNVIGAERIYVNRGNKLFKLKRYDEAIADYSRVIAVFPQKDELVYSSRAKALYRTGRYREALPDFDHAVTLKPDSKRLYYDRALTYRALGDFKLAEEDIRRSCALGGLCP
jgi:tetratricopeptide (TPR) repeat protein